ATNYFDLIYAAIPLTNCDYPIAANHLGIDNKAGSAWSTCLKVAYTILIYSCRGNKLELNFALTVILIVLVLLANSAILMGMPMASYAQTDASEPNYAILKITEVELSSENGTQWIELNNPTNTSFSTPLLINQSNTDKSILYSSV